MYYHLISDCQSLFPAKLRQLFSTFFEAWFVAIAFSGVFITILFPAWALQAQRPT